MERRLAAILAADVVGYSRLMELDEEGTLNRLTRLRSETLSPLIDRYRGRIFKLIGDGLLVEFPSVVDAISCAIAWQEAVAALERAASEQSELAFRIGINLGDVMIEGDDIHGDGVNIAARLESLALPGGICVSEDVYRQARGKLALEFQDLGPTALKNIAEPRRVFRLVLAQESQEPKGDAKSTLGSPALHTERPAVAILPFDNMSHDPDQDYFSDGLAEDIITALSLWRSFPVIARNSSFSFKGQQIRIEKIAEELGARYVLEGSVRKAGNRLRINAQLIDGRSGHHVWAERFDRELEDIFDVQDEITNRIAATIVPELELFEHKAGKAKRTEDFNAWDYYLKGMETFHNETCQGTRASIEMFEKATQLDPNYCDAWARLGWAFARLVMVGCDGDHKAFLSRAFEASRRALALDDSSSLAHMALSTSHIWAEETEQGLAEAQIALDLNPNFAQVGMAVGNRMDLVGQTKEGIAQMKRSLRLNPRDPMRWRYMAYLSRAYLSLDEFETAANWAQKAAQLRPDLVEAQFRYALCLAHLDQVQEAKTHIERCNEIDPNYVAGKANWRPYAQQARNDHVLSGLKRHGLIG